MGLAGIWAGIIRPRLGCRGVLLLLLLLFFFAARVFETKAQPRKGKREDCWRAERRGGGGDRGSSHSAAGGRGARRRRRRNAVCRVSFLMGPGGENKSGGGGPAGEGAHWGARSRRDGARRGQGKARARRRARQVQKEGGEECRASSNGPPGSPGLLGRRARGPQEKRGRAGGTGGRSSRVEAGAPDPRPCQQMPVVLRVAKAAWAGWKDGGGVRKEAGVAC